MANPSLPDNPQAHLQPSGPQPASPAGQGQPGPTLGQLLRPLLWRHRWALGLVLLAMPVSALMAMAVPYLTKLAVDDQIVPALANQGQGYDPAPLMRLVQLAGLTVVLGYLADAVYVSLLQKVGMRLLTDLRQSLYRRTLRLPRAYFDRHPIGSILTRITSDFEALGEGLATGVLSLFMDGFKMAAYLAMMFALNWRLTLVVLATAPLLAFLVWYFQKGVRDYFFKARQALSDATGYLQECLQGMKTVQLYAAEERVVRRFTSKNNRFFQAQNQSNLYDALLYSLVEGVTTLTLALLIWYSAGELLSGALTIGVLVAFLEYIQRLFVPLREFSQQIAVLQRSLAAMEHIDQLFRAPLDPAEENDEPTALLAPPPKLHSAGFEAVHFGYLPGQDVLKGVSFQVAAGQTLAIVGATGSGKSTIIRLLTRAYTGYRGHILINGQELAGLPASRLAQWVSVIHQNVFLFNGSVAFNISLGRPGLDQAAIEQAARYVHAHEFIERLPGGYDFVVTAGGANLSAGQAQLIAFARAIAAQAELIILDEATASVDSFTERLIQMALERLYTDKTVIAIAHRLSTIRHAHTILVMDDGQVKETGSHQQLMDQGGLYAKLVGQMEHGGPETGLGEVPPSPALPSPS